MASTRDWLPARLADQATVFTNVAAKIAAYEAALPITALQTAAIVKLCGEFDGAYNYTEQCRATTLATVQWRDAVFKGTPQGTPIPDPPGFPSPTMPANSTIGILAQFRDFRDIILAAP